MPLRTTTSQNMQVERSLLQMVMNPGGTDGYTQYVQPSDGYTRSVQQECRCYFRPNSQKENRQLGGIHTTFEAHQGHIPML